MNPNDISVLLFYAENGQVTQLHQGLKDAGYRVIKCLPLTEDLLSPVSLYCPDAVVFCVHSLDPRVLTGMATLNDAHPLPVTIFAERDAPHIVEQVMKAGVSAYVINDMQTSRLQSIITIAIARFRETQKLVDALAQAKNKLAGRKMVERAKGLLMTFHGANEADAYGRLRKMSMDKGVSIEQVAEQVVDVLSMTNTDNV